jgi:hypothetical protein
MVKYLKPKGLPSGLGFCMRTNATKRNNFSLTLNDIVVLLTNNVLATKQRIDECMLNGVNQRIHCNIEALQH